MKVLNKLRNVLLDGLIVILPIGLTGYIIWLAYNLIDGYLGETSYLGSQVSTGLQMAFGVDWIPGLTIIYTIIVILILGTLSRLYFWSAIQSYLDKLITSIPLVKKIYTPAQQVVKAILGERSYSSFDQPVMIEYPRRGIYTVGFETNRFDDKIAVYVFTAPDPFTGKLMILPKEDVTPLDLKVEEALRLVISMGISTPDREKFQSELDRFAQTQLDG